MYCIVSYVLILIISIFPSIYKILLTVFLNSNLMMIIFQGLYLSDKVFVSSHLWKKRFLGILFLFSRMFFRIVNILIYSIQTYTFLLFCCCFHGISLVCIKSPVSYKQRICLLFAIWLCFLVSQFKFIIFGIFWLFLSPFLNFVIRYEKFFCNCFL